MDFVKSHTPENKEVTITACPQHPNEKDIQNSQNLLLEIRHPEKEIQVPLLIELQNWNRLSRGVQHSHFTDKEQGSSRLNDMPKVT